MSVEEAMMSKPYTVRPGDNLTIIARRVGLRSWQELYNSPDNASFRAKRPNPNLIFPGDVIMVPDAASPTPPAPTPPTPPAPTPPAPTPVVPTEIVVIIKGVSGLLDKLTFGKLGIKKPTTARFLTAPEQTRAKSVYAESLDFTKIVITDGEGAFGAPFTTAVPTAVGFHVALNLGDTTVDYSTSDTSTLIHELGHAWQSQHHGSDPTAFMANSLRSQGDAFLDIPGAKLKAGASAGLAAKLKGLGVLDTAKEIKRASDDEDCSAYAYAFGKPFSLYGAEQIAQQIEDFDLGLAPAAAPILTKVKSLRANVPDTDNENSLKNSRFERKSALGGSPPKGIFHSQRR
jgi:hypothetical protein